MLRCSGKKLVNYKITTHDEACLQVTGGAYKVVIPMPVYRSSLCYYRNKTMFVLIDIDTGLIMKPRLVQVL